MENYDAWKSFPIAQQPIWPDPAELEQVLEKIRRLPPLVSPCEVDQCRARLAEAANGKYFVIQAGTCAERFADCNSNIIMEEMGLLHEMGTLFESITGKRTVLIGRIAGQYAKPRSDESQDVYRGDIVNEYEGSLKPDARRLSDAYFHAAATLNFIRSIHLQDGLSNGHKSPEKGEIRLTQCVNPIYTSHEALLLNYEDALTRDIKGNKYNLSAPFVWIGDRTRQLTHGHIHYAKQIENPVGIKVGPSITPDDLLKLLVTICKKPEESIGKVTLITRLGADKVGALLPALVKAVKLSPYKVIWSCDPCHGNTTTTTQGLKTRHVGKMLAEVVETIRIHKSIGSQLGGIHLEVTGRAVTECIGGDVAHESHLSGNYQTSCDPRLNRNQALEFIQAVAKEYHVDQLSK